jgi:hypothetical protein
MPLREVSEFSSYREFNDQLRVLASVASPCTEWNGKVEASLNGFAGSELRRLVGLPTRRASGAFFTGSVLAERLLGDLSFKPRLHFIYDPTVGAGDLLLAAARRLPLGRGLSYTLTSWGKCLAGTDLQPEFIEATKLRIALLARQRHGRCSKLPPNWQSLLPHIQCGNGFDQEPLFARATHLLMNPPYSSAMAPADCSWAGGRVSEAALFIARALECASPKARLLAILPDVLRSGSFQQNWREHVGDLGAINSVQRYGIFDDAADVDVFLLDLKRRSTKFCAKNRWPTQAKKEESTIADFFEVHVGRVVPHRDKEEGKEYPYIHPRNVQIWGEVKRFPEKRRHLGSAFTPPFVVIRRTSRPGHPYRAAATVICGKRPVAVENHLIVCEPRDKRVETCRMLMKELRNQRVNDFLDQRISCRHLTVSSVAAIPFKIA